MSSGMNPFRASELRTMSVAEPQIDAIANCRAPCLLPGAVRASTPRARGRSSLQLGAPRTTRPSSAWPLAHGEPDRLFSQLGSPGLEPSMHRCLKQQTYVTRWQPPPPTWGQHLLPHRRGGMNASLSSHLGALTSRPITAEERNQQIWSPREVQARAVRPIVRDPIHGVPGREVPSFSASWQTQTHMSFGGGRPDRPFRLR